MLEMRVKFQGEVQGVGFRATAHQIASRLGLTGFVRNTADGAVEILAQGKKEILEEFLAKLQSIFSTQVSQLDYTSPKKPYTDFSIIL